MSATTTILGTVESDDQTWAVLAADRHRNGVGGEGFYVGVIANEGRRMLVTVFPERDDEGEVDVDVDAYWPRVAVLDLDVAAEGNVYMHPRDGQPGGNAWRGADCYARAARRIVEVVEARP